MVDVYGRVVVADDETSTGSLWHNSAFVSLWLGSGISNVGDGIRLSALPLVAVTLTTDPRLIAGVTMAQFAPWIVFGGIGGALVDRWNRRRLILVTQLARAAVMAVLGAVVLVDAVAIWHVYLVAFLITSGEILVDPAVGAVVPHVVEREQLDEANGKLIGTFVVANEFAGAPIGAAAFAIGRPLPFGLDALSYLVSTVVLRRMPDTAVQETDRSHSAGPAAVSTSLRQEIIDGGRWLLAEPVLRPMALIMALYNLGAVAGFALLVLLVTDELGGSEVTFGLLLSIGAVGATVGSFAAARVVARIGRRRVLVGGVLVSSGLLLAISAAPTLAALFGLWFLIAVPAGIVMPISRAIQQRLTPNELLGRVNTITRSLTRGSMVVGAVLAGVIASLASVRVAMAVGGVIEGVAALMLARALRHREL